MKSDQSGAYNTFIEFKRKFSNINSELKAKIMALKDLQVKIDGFKKEKKQQKESEIKKILEEKTKQVEEKLRLKKKLTTEDLLVFQKKG